MMRPLSQITWKRIACPNDQLAFPDLVQAFAYDDRILVTDHFRKVRLWDMTDPLRLHLLAETPLRLHHRMKVLDKALVTFGQNAIEKLDLSDPSKPQVSLKAEGSAQYARSGCLAQGQIYVTHGNGVGRVVNGQIEPLLDIKNDKYFASYPSDIIGFEDTLYVAGRHAGLHIFKIQTDGRLT